MGYNWEDMGERREAWGQALEKARRELPNHSPHVLGAESGCDFREGQFRLPFFHKTYRVFFPEGEVREEGGREPTIWLKILFLHYLLTADGTLVADDWIAYRHLPGAELFEGRFVNMATGPLVHAFGQDLDGFRRAAEALGGVPMSRTGDAAYYFLAFPRLPVACLLYLGDEEVSPSVNILFDASAPHYLPTEDLSYLGSYLSQALMSHKQCSP
jgi:hypothetical protein